MKKISPNLIKKDMKNSWSTEWNNFLVFIVARKTLRYLVLQISVIFDIKLRFSLDLDFFSFFVTALGITLMSRLSKDLYVWVSCLILFGFFLFYIQFNNYLLWRFPKLFIPRVPSFFISFIFSAKFLPQRFFYQKETSRMWKILRPFSEKAFL